MLIDNWISGILRKKSGSARRFPTDAWQDGRNLLPLGLEIRRRWGTTKWTTVVAKISGTTLHSGCTYLNGGNQYLIQHWDDKVYIWREGAATVTTLINPAPDTDSTMFQIGKHIFFGCNSEDANGHPYNYIISPVGAAFTYRRASMPDFSATNVGDVTLSEVDVGLGNLAAGTYRYMFTFARYDGTTMISEGGGFDELVYTKEITTVGDSKVKIDFDVSLLSGVLLSQITHINVFRSLNIDGAWVNEELYNDPYKEAPIWPWYRFVDKVVKAGVAYSFTDNLSDINLKKISDTYDTRGWKPVGKMKYGRSAPNGRIFWMDPDLSGMLKFTENAVSPNTDITKYYEHYAEGWGHWYALGLDVEQTDRGLDISPAGDLLIFQDTRIFKIYQADPLRTDYLGEIKGYAAVRVDSSHGCKNVKANAVGADGLLYILGNNGYKGFDGERFVTPDFIEDADLDYVAEDKTNAVFYPGSKFKDSNGKNGIDQIILSYPTTSGADPDQCLVILFRGNTKIVTHYGGFKMIRGDILPDTSKLVITDATDKDHYVAGQYDRDRNGESSQSRIESWFQLKDFSHQDQSYSSVLNCVRAFGANFDQEFEARPVFDGVPRLNRRIITPNVDGMPVQSYQPRDITKYEKYFDDEAFGNNVSVIFFTRSLAAPVIESVELVLLKGERVI
jgi:hypothetical protein